MESIREFECLDETIFNTIVEHVNNDKQEMNESRVYFTEDETLRVDHELRSSKFKTIEDKELFAIVDNYLELINKQDKFYNFSLVKNNLTVIDYKEGDFFDKHSDFLSLTSNFISEFTMILCLDGDCEGGETALHINDNFTYKSKNSKTTGSCILFRKDLTHEGCKIIKGHKKILTMNVNAFEKSNGDILVVEFNNTEEKYIIPKSNIMSQPSILQAMLDNNKIQTLKLDNLPDDEIFKSHTHFQIIYNILMKSYIDFDDFKKYKNVIEYYNIDIENILIGKITDSNNAIKNISFNDDIIVFDNQNIKNFMTEIVKTKLLPYIPVRILFVEGVHSYGGGMSGTPPLKYNMEPVWCSAGDYNQILGYQKLIALRPKFKLFNNYNGFNCCVCPVLDIPKNDMTYFVFEDHDDIINFDEITEFVDDNIKKEDQEEKKEELEIDEEKEILPLEEYKLYSKDDYVKFSVKEIKEQKIISHIVGDIDPNDAYENGLVNMSFKYGIPKIENKDIVEMIVGNKYEHHHCEFKNHVHFIAPIKSKDDKGVFCLDKNNDMYLNRIQGNNLLEKIKSEDLFSKIKDKIKNNNIMFNLPQQKKSAEKNFCNEDIYVKTNILFVDCLVRINDSDVNLDVEFVSDNSDFDWENNRNSDYNGSDSDDDYSHAGSVSNDDDDSYARSAKSLTSDNNSDFDSDNDYSNDDDSYARSTRSTPSDSDSDNSLQSYKRYNTLHGDESYDEDSDEDDEDDEDDEIPRRKSGVIIDSDSD